MKNPLPMPSLLYVAKNEKNSEGQKIEKKFQNAFLLEKNTDGIRGNPKWLTKLNSYPKNYYIVPNKYAPFLAYD